MSKRSDNERVLVLTLIMAAVCAVSVGVAVAMLYNTSMRMQRTRLVDTAQSQARLIEAVARFDAVQSADHPGGSVEATLIQVREASNAHQWSGRTGEFTLARREGDRIAFLIRTRRDKHAHNAPAEKRILFDSELAAPMRRALSGLSGVMVGLDYRGETVLAAYEPVRGIDWGIVAKIDLAEVRAPFAWATLAALGCAAVLVVLGAPLFIRITRPIFERVRRSEARYRGIFESAPVSVWEEDWTEVIGAVERLRQTGVQDFAAYFAEHPDFVAEALRQVRVLDVNEETLAMFHAESKEQMLASLETVFATPDTLPGFVGELIALGQGMQVYHTEMSLRTVDGQLIHVLLTLTFPQPASDSGRVLVTLMDITERRADEQELRQRAEELKILNESMVGREIRMTELKEEVNALAGELGRELPYPPVWKDPVMAVGRGTEYGR